MNASAESRTIERANAVPRRVWRGTGLLILGRVFGSVCTFAMLWLLGRELTPIAFDRYTFYLAVFVLLDSLADFGTGQIAVQRTASDESATAAVLAATRRVRFAMGLVGVVLVGGGALVFGEPGAAWILLASLYPVTHVFELSNTVHKNRIDWRVPVAMRALGSALSLAFVLTLAGLGDREPAHFICATALGSAIANGCLHLVSLRHLPRHAPRHVPLEEIFYAALPLGLASLCQQAYFYVDNLFVRALCPPGDLGAYNVAVRVLSVLIMGALYATQAALPWLTREHAAGRLGDAIAKLAQPLFALSGLGAGLLCPWTTEILDLTRIPHLAIAGPSLRWLLGATTVIYAGAGLMTALVAAGQSRSILVIAAAALGVNLAANACLVPGYGIEGAGAATLLTEAVVALGAGLALARAGVRVLSGARAWGWLGGPVAFAVGVGLSSRLPFGGA